MEVRSGRSESAVRVRVPQGVAPHPPRPDRVRIVRRFTTALTAVPATPNAAPSAPPVPQLESAPSPVRSLHRPDQAHPPRRPASNGSSTGIPCRRDCLGPFPSPPPDGASRHIMPAMDQTSDILRFGPRTWLDLSRDAVKGSALRLICARSNQRGTRQATGHGLDGGHGTFH